MELIIHYKGKKCYNLNSNKYELLDLLDRKSEVLCNILDESTFINVNDFMGDDKELVLLFLCSYSNATFFYNNNEYDVVFAHAIKANINSKIRNFILTNLPLCLENRAIVFLSHKSYNCAENISLKKLEILFQKEQRTVSKNSNTDIKEGSFNRDFFEFWWEYNYWRFNVSLTKTHFMFFELVYSIDGFKLMEYKVKDTIMAYNVVFFDDENRIIHDVLFLWDKRFASRRPGIYSMINNINEAKLLNCSFSICYGNFPYKDDILKYFKEF